MRSLNGMLLGLAMAIAPSALPASDLVAAHDLKADASEASGKGLPILLLYTASYCHYCASVKAEVYYPMNADPAYQTRVLLREVEIDSAGPIRGFDGESFSHHEFAKARGITIVPTLEIVDETGAALVAPLIGSGVPDFYGFYVDQGIDKALLEIKTRKDAS
ncbi:MAG: thioredoxin family protein [Arenicellales bacterium]|jgi:thioredoxin-related protein